MLRGDNIVCGTSTTGTGTLTLAAVPQPPGGLDFDTWLRATGIGFGNSAVVPVSYTITEYTGSTFTNVKGSEKGLGLLTLGGSAGIANCTLTRTVSQASITGMDGSTPAFSKSAALSIGTAANVLVTIAPSTADLMGGFGPIVNVRGDAIEQYPPIVGGNSTVALTRGYQLFYPFYNTCPKPIKRATIKVTTNGGASCVTEIGLYAINPDGHTLTLLVDFGAFDCSATASVSRLSASSHFTETIVPVGPLVLATISSGGTGNPSLRANGVASIPMASLGTSSGDLIGRMAFGDGSRTAGALAATFDLSSPPVNFTFVSVADIAGSAQTVPQVMFGNS